MKFSEKPLSLNERRLVELVYRNGAIARIDLTEVTDMTGASVWRLTAGLEDLGLFKQTTDRSGARGQPKKLLSIQKTKFRSVGIYLYLDRMVGVLIDFAGKVLGQSSLTVSDRTLEGILHAAHSLATSLVSDTNTNRSNFLGIGISVPGNFGAYGNLLKAHEAFNELRTMNFRKAA